jgi:putative acetyltransferase
MAKTLPQGGAALGRINVQITQESPLGADLSLLMARHTADMHADTPPESIHMMDAGQLAQASVRFFVMRDAGVPIAMGAIKEIAPQHGEIKSMHVLAEYRGQGLSKKMLDHLIDSAHSAGFTRLSLETGTQAMFAPAKKLYETAGFTQCPPFADYFEDPNSLYLTLSLATKRALAQNDNTAS